MLGLEMHSEIATDKRRIDVVIVTPKYIYLLKSSSIKSLVKEWNRLSKNAITRSKGA